MARRGALEPELPREPEVDDFGVVPLFGVRLPGRCAEDLGGGGAMDVPARGERCEQAGVLRIPVS